MSLLRLQLMSHLFEYVHMSHFMSPLKERIIKGRVFIGVEETSHFSYCHARSIPSKSVESYFICNLNIAYDSLFMLRGALKILL